MAIAMKQSHAKAKPFENSLSALAQVAMREAGADGYAFFQRPAGNLGFVRQDAAGSEITEDVLANPLGVTYSLGEDGILAFIFHDHTRLRQARPQLDRIAGTIDAVWRAVHTVEQYSQLANHVAELETSLMDAKIADRTLGFLVTPVKTRSKLSPAMWMEYCGRLPPGGLCNRFHGSWKKKWRSGG